MQCKNNPILIIGNRIENRQVFVQYLSQSKYDITQASNGEEALKIIENGLKPSLILLDMPHRGGSKVTQKIRKIWQAEQVPILWLIDKNQNQNWETGLEMGVNDYLTQPLSKEELIFRINTQIELCRLKAENQRLSREGKALKQENTDLKILLETSTEHGDTVVNQLKDQADEAVRESERKLAQFLEAVPVGVGVLDANSKLYFLNQKAKEIFAKGVDPDTPVDRLSEAYQIYIAGTNELYPSENLPIVRSLKGENVTADDLEVHQGNQRIPIEVWATPIYDADGNIAYSINALQDIAERKRTEKILADYNRNLEQEVADRTQELEEKNRQLQQEIRASEIAARQRQLLEDKLRTSEKRMRAVFEAMTDIILVIDSQGTNIEVAPTNPGRLYEGTTYLVNQTIEQFIQGERAENWLSQIRRVIETQETIDFDYSLPINKDEVGSFKSVGNTTQERGEPADHSLQTLSFTLHPSEVWFTASLSPLPDGSVLWVARNITARKRAEMALRQSEEKFAKAFRSCPSAFTITRQIDGCHIEINDSFCQFIGYTRAEVLGRTAVDLNLWVNWEDRTQLFQILQEEGVIRNYEFTFRTKSGEVRTALLSAEMIDLDGQIHIISVSQDISDRKQAQAALQQAKEAAETANRAKSRFLANMSHELRTPLNAIIGFTQLLTRDSSLNPEQQEYLGIIQRSGEHLLELINNVLQMSKIEVGRVTLNKNNFDLYHLLDTLEAMFKLPVQNKNLQLVFDRTPTLPQYVQTDESKLRQVLINLLGNAIKFTTEGGVTLRIASKFKSEESNNLPVKRLNVEGSQPSSYQQHLKLQPVTLYFEVEDTGFGIAPEEMDSLFEPFLQTQTGRQALEGTGLGLPIARQFVQLMGGDIRVSSHLGKGSIFHFEIEVDIAQEPKIVTTQASRRVIGLESGQPKYRILVVDDRLESRVLLVKLLASVGFEVLEAVNGQEAIELWSSWEPHLIWMDMRMPVMDGYEATKRIKADLKGQATAIVALTASAFEEERSVVLSAGCDDFVRKPFRESVIFEKMTQHLGVRYIYAESASSASEGGRQKMESEPGDSSYPADSAVPYILEPSSFYVMPIEWVQELYQAAVTIDNERILQLIEQIPAAHNPLAKVIADLVNNFRCDKILDLIEQAKILEQGTD
ncbi:response regulator [Allocoleopsis franciscana]|uniref:Circadian input-output histidine kinase CikA n=1 Tax=Allocoleopsis franciscana PCC 7113 TaxID=1173027 RepID=K9WG28_9CYAN|nr:response regulator [Allocoleopsis franciscana]AFZ18724.1 PAS domain S-box [Allocoleopsis franciscana PCC 7113]